MRAAFALALPLLIAAPACKPRPPKVPEWVQTIPSGCGMAVSVQAGWVLDQPQFQSLVMRFPMADQILDLTLRKAKIAPRQETGRITFFVLELPSQAPQGLEETAPKFLIQLAGFRDPRALQTALTEAFPPEGTLSVGGQEHPLLVVMDINNAHFRAVADAKGTIWIGDLKALAAHLNSPGASDKSIPLAAEWINATAPFQVFLRPQGMFSGKNRLQTLDLQIPQGVEALFWSATPGSGANAAYALDLSVAGAPEGIQQVVPWLQKFVAVASAVQGTPMPPPELLQTSRRAGLRCQLTEAQLKAIMAKLNMPAPPQNKAVNP